MRREVVNQVRLVGKSTFPNENWVALEDRANEAIAACLAVLIALRLREDKALNHQLQERSRQTLHLLSAETSRTRISEIENMFSEITKLLVPFESSLKNLSSLELNKLTGCVRRAKHILEQPFLPIPNELMEFEHTCSSNFHSHADGAMHTHSGEENTLEY